MSQTTIDADDIDRFDRQADQWWNPDGPMKPLHLFTPVRLDYILCGARRAGLSGPAGHAAPLTGVWFWMSAAAAAFWQNP